MKDDNEQHIELDVQLARDLHDGDDNLLVINQGRHHHAFDWLQDTQRAHTITWKLTGNAKDGEFCALDETANPGFLWLVRAPGEGIFRKLQRVEKNKLAIHNHHHGKASEGIWHYQLFARFGDRIFGVPLTFTSGPSNSPNPSIKNTLR